MTPDGTACLTGIVLPDSSTAADLPPKHGFGQNPCSNEKTKIPPPGWFLEKTKTKNQKTTKKPQITPVVPFRSYLQNVLTTVIAARDKTYKPNTLEGSGVGDFQVTSNRRKTTIKIKILEEN